MKILYIMMACLPMSLKRPIMTRLLGWDIHPTAHIAIGAVVICEHLTMRAGARIERLAAVHGLRRVSLGRNAGIGAKCRISGAPLSSGLFPNYPERVPDFHLGDESGILNMFIDCQDRVEIGSYSVFAGRGSAIFTHGIDVVNDCMSVGPVTVGNYCMIGAYTKILKDVTISDRCVVGAGSVVAKSLTDPQTLYAGSPAIKRRALPADAKFFTRGAGPLN